MKHLFKTFLMLAAFAGFAYSCDSDDEEKSGEAKLLSFGFYAEDNEGVLLEDYVVTDTTGTNWTINLPAEVDKSSLVARFEVSENDSVVVSGVGQVSGVTANNFTVPVDYYVMDGKNNKRYTITIGKASSYVWSKVATLTSDSIVEFKMKVNPVNSLPYIMYKQDRASSTDEKAAMIKLVDGAWQFVGSSAGISEGRIDSYLDFVFDNAGSPYVAYPDYISTIPSAAVVKKFDGTSWVAVGTQPVTAAKVTYTALGFAPDNKLMLFNMLNAAAGGLQRRECVVSTFDGTAWATNAALPGRAAELYAYLPVTKLVGDALYLGLYNANSPSTFSVYKFQNGAWTTIADKVLEEGATTSNLRDFDMDVDNDGNIYIAVADNASDPAVFKPRVKKFTAATQTWSNVGDVLNLDLNTIRKFDLAVSPYGVPFLMYRNANQYPSIISLDSETQQWTAEVVLESVVADDLWLDFTPTGQAFASFDNEDNIIITYKYAAPAN